MKKIAIISSSIRRGRKSHRVALWLDSTWKVTTLPKLRSSILPNTTSLSSKSGLSCRKTLFRKLLNLRAGSGQLTG